MSKTTEQLKSIKSGRSTRVRGREVTKDGDRYLIDGEEYSIDEAVTKLDQSGSAKSGIDYDWTVFLECQPYDGPRPVKTHRCRDKTEHSALLEAVKKRNNYLWYGGVTKNGDRCFAKPPFIIDWDSIPEHPYEVKKRTEQTVKPQDPKCWDGGLSCPFCGDEVSSTPGRTLHVKAKHLDRFEEYQKLLVVTKNPKCNQPAPVYEDDEDDEDDVVSRQAELDGIKCPFCHIKINSTSGRTLHVQGKHPERLQEYQKLLIGGKL